VEAREVALENAVANEDNLTVGDATLLQAQASLARAQAVYNNTVIRAPFDGVISSVDASMGEAVSISDSVVSLISNNNYEITVLVPEADIANLTIGDRAVVTFDAYDEEEFEAEVVFVTPSAETVEGVPVFEAKLEFKNQDERIRVGLSADVEIFAEERSDVFAVPSRAIIREVSGSFVRLLVDDDHIERVPVKTGLRSSEGLIEILSGLNEGDKVITFIDGVTLEKLGGE
jgi:HlyD family secretion protein